MTTKRLGRLVAATAALATMASGVPAVAQPTGGEVFANNCVACHQATGKGIPGAFPALAGDPFVKGPPERVIVTVLKGRGGMPRFGTELSDADIAAAITYIRSAWGNDAPPVSPSQVGALRTTPATPASAASLQAH